ncbi:hypothetical protein GQ55_1G058700 [Panicum hallii var. hallii]|uniref:Uncharacterized protein n=1 Tax=Panicum hallii var. hallii TaxID=1504633 RepID=A0A2T7F2Q9_9POAL|nr:hypothetical protein GQ55_1G058700 [Panicum hallii var. hallii]
MACGGCKGDGSSQRRLPRHRHRSSGTTKSLGHHHQRRQIARPCHGFSMAREGATPPRWQRPCELRSRAAPMDSGGGALASSSSTLRTTVAVTEEQSKSRRRGAMEVMTAQGVVTRRRRTTGVAAGGRNSYAQKITADRG